MTQVDKEQESEPEQLVLTGSSGQDDENDKGSQLIDDSRSYRDITNSIFSNDHAGFKPQQRNFSQYRNSEMITGEGEISDLVGLSREKKTTVAVKRQSTMLNQKSFNKKVPDLIKLAFSDDEAISE